MSCLTEQKTKLKTEQIKEALMRMKKLGLHSNVIKEFDREGKLNKSETNMGILYWLDEEEEKMVREWEDQTGNICYHVIKTPMVFGTCYSLLFVSPNVEEWEIDNEDLKCNSPLVYVFNADAPECSEYGCIRVTGRFGGLVRTA